MNENTTDLPELYAMYRDMVEEEYEKAADSGVLDVNPSDFAQDDHEDKIRKEYSTLQIAHDRIMQVERFKDGDKYPTGIGTQWFRDLMVMTMMMLAPATQFNILPSEVRRVYATILTQLRIGGLIHEKLLDKYGLLEHVTKASTFST